MQQKEKNEELDLGLTHPATDIAGSTAAGAHQPRYTRRPSLNVQGSSKQSLSAIPRKATGPRTKAGKARSKYNAMKNGFFANSILLAGESAAQHKALRKGLWEEFQPESPSEMEDVEYLVTLYWRRRRVAKAENAQIVNAAVCEAYNSKSSQALELWDQSRAGETTGGMLRHSSNPLVLREAIDMLTICRTSLEKHGFYAEEDPWLLRKLYGLDHDGAAPMGLFRTYQVQSKLATGGQIKSAGGYDALRKDKDELKGEMLRAFDEEIERLKIREVLETAIDDQKRECATIAASVPPREVMDGIIRVEAHISREIERTLNRLERSRRRRQGQPEPPTLRLKLDE